MDFDFYSLIVRIIPLIFAITVHEAAHGYFASYCGDNTAKMLGRLTLNPIKHIDPIGTVALPLMMFLFNSPILFGWAKPVPVNPRNYSRFSLRKSDALVSFAGPGSNLVMMFLWAFLCGISPAFPEEYARVILDMSLFGIMINAVLFTLNMLPILPLDGGHLVEALLPPKYSMVYRKYSLGNYGMFFVMALLIFEPTARIFGMLVRFVSVPAITFARLLASLF